MRTILELLVLARNNYVGKLLSGLCDCATTLWVIDLISEEERNFLKDYIWKHKPWYKPFAIKNKTFYWKALKDAPRLKWLDYHIKKNS